MNREPLGFIIVNKLTNQIDWDGEVHPTREKAIQSLCAGMYVQTTQEEHTDPGIRRHWERDYKIREVRDAHADAALIEEIQQRASLECETDEEYAQAEADRDTLLALLGHPA